MPEGRLCEFPDCGRPHVARKYCRTHYSQFMQGKPLTPIPPRIRNKGQICAFEDCNRPAEGRGLCSAHRQQVYQGREPKPLKPPALAEPCASGPPRKARKTGRRKRNECATEGCPNRKGFTELCLQCYAAQWEGGIRAVRTEREAMF